MGVIGLDVEATTDDGSREHSCLAVSETEVSLFLSFFFANKKLEFLDTLHKPKFVPNLKISPTYYITHIIFFLENYITHII